MSARHAVLCAAVMSLIAFSTTLMPSSSYNSYNPPLPEAPVHVSSRSDGPPATSALSTPPTIALPSAGNSAGRLRIFDAALSATGNVDKYNTVDLDPCAPSLPAMEMKADRGFTTAVVEVGTNLAPESLKLARHAGHGLPRGLRQFTTVDPLPAAAASTANSKFAHRIVQAAIGEPCGVVPFFEDGALSGMLGNTMSNASRRGRWFDAAVVPLSRVLAAIVESGVTVEMLIVDAQGFDLSVVKSAGAAMLRRHVAMLVLECQHLPAGHAELLSPAADNCRNASTALQSAEFGFRFGFCMRNMGPEERNCVFYNPAHPAFSTGNSASTPNATGPLAVLAKHAGELWQVMCPSLTISHLFLNGCQLSTLIWRDPADGDYSPLDWGQIRFSPAQCAILRAIMPVMPAARRKRSGNMGALHACDTGASLHDAVAEQRGKHRGPRHKR